MTFLFWLLWLFDLATCLLLFIAGDFRRSFTGNNPQAWVAVVLLVCVLASPIVRFVFKRPLPSLITAGIPVLALLIWYMADKATE